MAKYIADYKKAKKDLSKPINQTLVKYSTLQYFEKEIGLQKTITSKGGSLPLSVNDVGGLFAASKCKLRERINIYVCLFPFLLGGIYCLNGL